MRGTHAALVRRSQRLHSDLSWRNAVHLRWGTTRESREHNYSSELELSQELADLTLAQETRREPYYFPSQRSCAEEPDHPQVRVSSTKHVRGSYARDISLKEFHPSGSD